MSDELTTEDFIWLLANSDDPDERLYAAFKLGRNRETIVVQPLIDAIDDPDVTVRARVAEALGTRDEPQVIAPLMQLLENDEAVQVRRMAAQSLGHLAQAQAVDALITALKDSDPTVRAQVAEALGKISSDESATPLVQTFLYDEDETVRYFAKVSLGHVGNAAVDALLNALSHTDHPRLISDICEILGTLGDVRAHEALQGLKDHDDDAVAETAAWALKQIGD